MIEGLTITISGVELKTLCEQAALYHRERSENKRKESERCKHIAEEHKGEDRGWSAQSFMYKAKDLSEREDQLAKELDFYAAHLEPEERYRLGEKELNKIGIVKPDA